MLFVIRLGLALGDARTRFQSEAEKEPLGESPIKRKKHLVMRCFCDPFGARTQDPNIKSVVLYQLS